MRALVLAALLLLPLALALAPTADAQTGVLYEFELEGPTGTTNELIHLQSNLIPLTFRDLSRDSPGALVPGGSPVDQPLGAHTVSWDIEITSEESSGWTVGSLPSLQTWAGQEVQVELPVTPGGNVVNPYAQVRVTAIIDVGGNTTEETISLLFYTPSIPSFRVTNQASLEIGPQSVGTARLRVASSASLQQVISFEILENNCGLYVSPPSSVVLRGHEAVVREFSIAGPEAKFWYNYESCSVRLKAVSTINPDIERIVPVGVDVNGFYVAEEWAFWTIVLVAIIVVMVLVVKRYKERLEEEIIGKPQKPWTIPVEEVYLKHLRKKDERAWYVVRNYIMEEEYRSSLLWYKHYKRATESLRAKERLVLKHEHNYDKWKRNWEQRIAKPERGVELFERKLQRKLDRQSRGDQRKAVKNHAGRVKKMKAAYEKKVERAAEQHAKAAAKAAKKKQPVPAKPNVPVPDYGAEPGAGRVLLQDHKWWNKVLKERKKAQRKRGDLEVKFERADARHLAKIRRKVARFAKKIDDPDFVAQHPLLMGA